MRKLQSSSFSFSPPPKRIFEGFLADSPLRSPELAKIRRCVSQSSLPINSSSPSASEILLSSGEGREGSNQNLLISDSTFSLPATSNFSARSLEGERAFSSETLRDDSDEPLADDEDYHQSQETPNQGRKRDRPLKQLASCTFRTRLRRLKEIQLPSWVVHTCVHDPCLFEMNIVSV